MVEWVEREEELSIICIKVVVKGKGNGDLIVILTAFLAYFMNIYHCEQQ